nr:DUF2344 domain-containing protein [Anaerolineae bacterium]
MLETNTPSEQSSRLRIEFGKRGILRYTSHLDLARIWERTLLRAQVPLIYSQGFNPRPKMQFAAALPLGAESTCELLDIWVHGNFHDLQELQRVLVDSGPQGLEVYAIHPAELSLPPLQMLTHAAIYRVELAEACSCDEISRRVGEFLRATELIRIRRGKSYNLRPLVRDIQIICEQSSPATLMLDLLLSQQEGTGRPDEVVHALGCDPALVRITRIAIDLHQSSAI